VARVDLLRVGVGQVKSKKKMSGEGMRSWQYV
jgi:hypothetical protein